MDSIIHCLQVHKIVLLFVLIKCQTNYLSCSYTLIISLYHPCIQGSLSGETREYFHILYPNIAPTIDQREILLSLSIHIYHEKKIYWQISQRKITIFSILLIPDLKKGKLFWKNISSYRIAKISHLYTKWNVLQQMK